MRRCDRSDAPAFFRWDEMMRSKRCLLTLAVTLLSIIVASGGAEERISFPHSGPLGALTYGLNVAETAHGDVAVWYVVAINEAGSAVSKTVEPKHERVRGVRR